MSFVTMDNLWRLFIITKEAIILEHYTIDPPKEYLIL